MSGALFGECDAVGPAQCRDLASHRDALCHHLPAHPHSADAFHAQAPPPPRRATVAGAVQGVRPSPLRSPNTVANNARRRFLVGCSSSTSSAASRSTTPSLRPQGPAASSIVVSSSVFSSSTDICFARIPAPSPRSNARVERRCAQGAAPYGRGRAAAFPPGADAICDPRLRSASTLQHHHPSRASDAGRRSSRGCRCSASSTHAAAGADPA
mmetsp:Transcript_54082/g.126365  ORF Transcript_54082/g.126365 Transcript_54082/m.126365 type:complete len:212 (+) Transcript_54082:257-892(+)